MLTLTLTLTLRFSYGSYAPGNKTWRFKSVLKRRFWKSDSDDTDAINQVPCVVTWPNYKSQDV